MMDTSPSASPSVCDIDQGDGLTVATIMLVGVAVIFVALRFTVRLWIVKGIGWDDWTILLGVVGTIIGGGLDFVKIHYGFGRHQDCLTASQLQEFEKYVYGEWIQTFTSLMWTKVSICLFLLRIPISNSLLRPLEAGVVVLVLSNIVLTFCWILQCRPIDAAWNENIPGQCFSRNQNLDIIIAQAIISVVSDFAFASFPIMLLWRVQIELKTKIGLCVLMGFGVITGTACVVRTVLKFQAVATDASYGGIVNWYWRTFEVQFGIIAACITTLPPGYRWLRDSLKPSRSFSSTHLPLADQFVSQIKYGASVSTPAKAYRVNRDTANTMLSDPEIGNHSNGIWRTTQVNVGIEQKLRDETMDYEGRPLLEVDLDPISELYRSLWKHRLGY